MKGGGIAGYFGKAPTRKGKSVKGGEIQRKFISTKTKEKRKNIYQNRQTGVIVGLSLRIMTEEEIQQQGRFCHVTSSSIKCLTDLTMGPTDQYSTCATCYKDLKFCTGHFGYTTLAVGIPNPLFIKEIMAILKLFDYNSWKKDGEIVCLFDNTKDYRGITGWERLKLLIESASDKTAKTCLSKGDIKTARAFSNEKDSPFITTDGKAIKIDPIEIRSFFYSISHAKDPLDDVSWNEKIGLENTPLEGLILTAFPILPNTIRLVSFSDEGEERQSDLTEFYRRIIEESLNLEQIYKENITTGCVNPFQTVIDNPKAADYYIKMYQAVWNLMLKKDDSAEQSLYSKKSDGGRSIIMHVNGKDGTVRGTILGKRSDFAGRTVLVGDYRIPMDSIGIPFEFAEKVTIPELVTEQNIDEINMLIASGDIKTMKNQKGIPLATSEKSVAEVGYQITRKIKDGDPVVFSRQPVLHKGSIMCYKAKIMPPAAGNVFRINLAVTTPHNADFDGDEGNVAVPQNPYARAEVLTQMLSTNCIRGDAASSPLIGLVQDSIIGAARLTKQGVVVDQKTYLQAGLAINLSPDEIKEHIKRCRGNIRAFSGKGMFSMLFPKFFSYSKQIKGKENIIIKNGLLLSGVLDDVTLGRKSNSIIDALFLFKGGDKSGPQLASEFISNTQVLLQIWLGTEGFSIGYGDCILPEEVEEQIQSKISQARITAINLQNSRPDNQEAIDVLETKLRQILVALKGDILKLIQKTGESLDNRFLQMIESGAKGGRMNLAEILGILGQQEIEGGRIPFMLRNKTKITPHFESYSKDPLARGLCTSSFSKGLQPLEFYLHAISTRPNMIETNLSPSETGYFYRRLWVLLEDMFSHRDHSIRDENGRIVQFLYGGDGFNPKVMNSYNGQDQFVNVGRIINNINSRENE